MRGRRMTGPGGAILLYDGLCGICDAAVQGVLRADREGRVRFAALQGEFAAALMRRHPELETVDSLILVRSDGQGGEQTYIRSDAIVQLATLLGGPWRALGLLRVLPRVVRDAAYDLLARHRHRLFRRREECRVPTPTERDRFLD